MRDRIVLLLAAAALVALAGCSSNHSSGTTGPSMGTLRVHLTDDPAAYDAVNIVVRQVSVHASGADGDSTGGWQVLSNDSTATYDLLKLQNGIFAEIGSATLPAGHYDQIRLLLGPGSNVVVGGVAHDLKVPSGMQSGLKVIGDFVVPSGGTVDVALDFDAARSIHQTGNGQYMLKPVIKALIMDLAGAIHGIVAPAGASAHIAAIRSGSTDTLGTAAPAADGAFTLSVLPAGTYDVAFRPDTTYRDTTITGVSVTAGTTTDIGTVQLTAK